MRITIITPKTTMKDYVIRQGDSLIITYTKNGIVISPLNDKDSLRNEIYDGVNPEHEKIYDIVDTIVTERLPSRPQWKIIHAGLVQLEHNGKIVLPSGWSQPDTVRKWFVRYKKRIHS